MISRVFSFPFIHSSKKNAGKFVEFFIAQKRRMKGENANSPNLLAAEGKLLSPFLPYLSSYFQSRVSHFCCCRKFIWKIWEKNLTKLVYKYLKFWNLWM